jgi:hypothetical protein
MPVLLLVISALDLKTAMAEPMKAAIFDLVPVSA